MRNVPPPPYTTVLRAISLAAVTSLVWSTIPKPASIARARTACRRRTTSSELRTAIVSSFSTTKRAPRVIDGLADHGQPLIDVERRAHAGERKPELNQGYGDGGSHTDDHGDRVEHPRHGGDIVEHAADERVDDLESRYVDHDAARPLGDDPVGEVVLQFHRQAVVHVHLDRNEKAVTDLEYRYFRHGGSNLLPTGPSVDDRFPKLAERQGESVGHRRLGNDAKFEPEMDDGLRDLRPNAADDAIGPHQARGRDGLDQVLRHQCVDRWHPGNVDDRDLGARGDDLFEQVFHDGLGARAVERADQRQGKDALPQSHDGGGQLEQLLLLTSDDVLAALLEGLHGVEPELVEEQCCSPHLAR